MVINPRAQVGRRGQKNAPTVTDPYRPRIGATPSNDIELVVKGRDELPAETGLAYVKTTQQADAQEDTTGDMVEVLEYHCFEKT